MDALRIDLSGPLKSLHSSESDAIQKPFGLSRLFVSVMCYRRDTLQADKSRQESALQKAIQVRLSALHCRCVASCWMIGPLNECSATQLHGIHMHAHCVDKIPPVAQGII